MAKRTYKGSKRTRKTSRGKKSRKVSKRSKRCPKGQVMSYRKSSRTGKLKKSGCIPKPFQGTPKKREIMTDEEIFSDFVNPFEQRIKKRSVRKSGRKSRGKKSLKTSRGKRTRKSGRKSHKKSKRSRRGKKSRKGSKRH
jgi:hypothetical protein